MRGATMSRLLLASLPLCGFSFSATFGPLQVTWSPPTASSLTLNISYDGSAGAVWWAFGVSSAFSMTPGDCTVFQPTTNALTQFGLTAESMAGVAAAPTSPLTATTIATGAGNKVTVSFTRPLAAGTYGGAQSIASSGDVKVIWAVGKSGEMTSQCVALGRAPQSPHSTFVLLFLRASLLNPLQPHAQFLSGTRQWAWVQ